MADSHAMFGSEPNCCRPVCLQSTFQKDDHAETQGTKRHSPPPPRPLRLCVITYCRCHVRRAQRAIRCITITDVSIFGGAGLNLPLHQRIKAELVDGIGAE
ncbi:hypothetical protein GGR91_000148 [Sphingorhabdus rigui]|uniref:Uncharacterized protein n=1 Tax=Sphingorhabdus rigui TaxID=1282858 RepID=A0A840AY88_9SPHN|nr:hypothetical protein [Sphingorhabdus rigui]